MDSDTMSLLILRLVRGSVSALAAASRAVRSLCLRELGQKLGYMRASR